VRFVQLKNVALLQALSVYLRRLIIKEEVSEVNDTSRIETLDHKPQSLKEYEDFNHPLFNHLDSIHLIARLEDQLAWVVLSAPDGIDKFVKDHGRDPFFKEVYLLKHA
jgi:hypothetical protein